MCTRLIVALVVAIIFGFAQGQVCRDTKTGCRRTIYCRFFSSHARGCLKTCGFCPTPTTGPAFDVWSTCSKTCDSGTRVRVRSCALNFDECPKDFEDCNPQPCPTTTCPRGREHRYQSGSSCCTRRNNCGASTDIARRILGGTEAMLSQWPWMLRFEQEIDENTSNLCGATLIGGQWALTAGHCVSGYDLDKLTVIAAFGTGLERTLNVDFVVLHPDYSFPENDIALIKFTNAVDFNEFTQPLCLPLGEITSNDTQCFIAGWGATQVVPNIVLPATLQEARIRVLRFDVCTEAYKNRPNFGDLLSDERHICAGILSGGVDSCFGDSGGPLMCQRCASCSWYPAGVVSAGPVMCGTPNEPGVYTRIVHFEPWINSIIGLPNTQTFTCN